MRPRTRPVGGDFFGHNDRLWCPHADAAVFFRNEDTKPATVGQFIDELVGILLFDVFLSPVLVVEVAADITEAVPDEALLLCKIYRIDRDIEHVLSQHQWYE